MVYRKPRKRRIKYQNRIELRVGWRAIAITTVFNLAAVVISFLIFYANLGSIGTGLFYSFIVLGVAVTVSVLAWVFWTVREIKDKRISTIISFSMIITLAVMLMIIWQFVVLLGGFI